MLILLPWLFRIQILLGLVRFFGPHVGFVWPPPVWAVHRVIAVVAPAMTLVAFRRGAWTGSGQPARPGRPGVRVAARFALLAPLALGLCFSAGVLAGRGWAAVHIGLAGAAFLAIERATAALRGTRVATADGAERPMTPDATIAARSFYGDMLGGRQVWPAGRDDANGSLWFLLGATLVEVSADPGHVAAPVVLDVDAPDELAERCWDAGFTVRVHDDGRRRTPVSVFDPFGRRIDLTSRVPTTHTAGR